MTLIKQIFLLAVAVTLVCPVFAQTRTKPTMAVPVKGENAKRASATPPAKKASGNQPIAPFSLHVIAGNHMNQNFRGHPIDRILAALKKNLACESQDEFETTADYNARRAADVSRPFLGGLTVADTFAFVVPFVSDREGGSVQYSYDPDTITARLLVISSVDRWNGISDNYYCYNETEFWGEASNKISRSYIDLTRSEKLDEGEFMFEGIAFTPNSFLARDNDNSPPVVLLQSLMESARAKRFLPSLKALFVFKLTKPYVIVNYEGKEYGRYFGTVIQRDFLYGDILGLVIFSAETGEIIGRFPENFGKTLPSY